MPTIPLAKPRLSDSDIAAAVEVLKTGYLVCGPVVERFESALADYLGVRHVICVSSGTAALHLGLLALGVGPGDDVIVPAFSYPATANVVELAGAKPVFVDCEPGGFNIDPLKIENNITAKTKAIMVVHGFGWPADMKKISEIAGKHGLPVFEDAACALGSSVDGKMCGSLGDLAAFSFHPRKILFTGEGGAIATDDDDVAQLALALRNHGQRPGTTDFVMPGFNYRLTEFQAALGASQLVRFEATIKRRRQIAALYNSHLASLDFIGPPLEMRGIGTNYQTYVAYASDNRRDALMAHLKEAGIASGIGTYSIPHTTCYSRKYGYGSEDFPCSLDSYENLISLPLYEDMDEADIMAVVSAIKSFDKCNDRAAGKAAAATEVALDAKN